MSETIAPEVGTKLVWKQPILEVTEVWEDHVQIRDQFGGAYPILASDYHRYEVIPTEEQCEVKAAAYDDWHDRDLRREALAQAIALAKGSTVIGTDIIQNAEKFYTYLKGTQA